MADGEEQCPRCKLFCAPGAPDWSHERSPALHPRVGLCWDCVNHQGDTDTVKRSHAQHHLKMLGCEYDVMRQQVQSAESAIVQMRYELAMRPVRTVVRSENLDQVVGQQGRRESEEAYRRRDIAMGALSDPRLLHHKYPDARTQCICGKRYEKCDAAEIADRWGGAEWWQQSQVGRAHRGLRHNLKPDHPALKDRGYSKDRYGA